MISSSSLKTIPFWHKIYCLSTETRYPPSLLPWLLLFSKNNVICLLSEKLNVSKDTETFFFCFIKSPNVHWKCFDEKISIKSNLKRRRVRGGKHNFLLLSLRHTTEFLNIICGNEEESACLWSEGNPIVFLNSASCSNFALPLRQNPTLWLSLKPT